MKILIVDDHALFREGLCHVLHALEGFINILEASNCDLAIQFVTDHPDLDLVLLDLNMPGKDGFAALNILTKNYPALPVVILSASSLRSDMQCSLDTGAMGFIPKDTTSTVMLNALRLILSGGIYVPTNMSQQPDQNHVPVSVLTSRQLEVLTKIEQGHSATMCYLHGLYHYRLRSVVGTDQCLVVATGYTFHN